MSDETPTNVIKIPFGKSKTKKEIPVIQEVTEAPYQYDKIADKHQRAMLINIIREILTQVKIFGLIDNHHFYITFDTQIDGVVCPKHLHKGDLTIVLQYVFSDLEVDDYGFSVVLNFDNIAHTVTVPWNAIIMFEDRSCQFGVQLIDRK
jgi:hypothetical protein